MLKRLVMLALIAPFLVFPAVAAARIIDSWPYDRLFKEADLVVIARAVKTEAAGDTPPKHHWPLEFVAQNTTFRRKHLLKGDVPGDQIKVLHFKFGDKLQKGAKPPIAEPIQIIDGPLFMEFHSGTGPEYLLFLRRLKDGRYEPVSGRIDPALAVRDLSAGGTFRAPGLKGK